MFLIYNLVLLGFSPLLILLWLYGKLVLGKYQKPLRRRLGMVGLSLPPQKEVWLIHAVSVGEAVAALPLVKALRRTYPDVHFVFSTVTETGQAQAKEKIPADDFVFFPLDFVVCVRTFLELVQPQRVIVLETEIWPNFLRECHRRKIDVSVVNARLSDKSFARYALIRPLMRKVLQNLRIFAQSEEDGRRFLSLGAQEVYNAGNLKFDQLKENLAHPRREMLGRDFLKNRENTLIFGSFHQKEARELLPGLVRFLQENPQKRVFFAPRHMHWLPAFLQDVSRNGLTYGLRSESSKAESGLVVVDTYGELALMYEVASVAVIGGSFEPVGGHSPLEPGLFGCAVLYGPYVSSFRDICSEMEEAQASVRLQDLDEMWKRIDWLFEDTSSRERMGEGAREFVRERQGATGKILKKLDSATKSASLA